MMLSALTLNVWIISLQIHSPHPQVAENVCFLLFAEGKGVCKKEPPPAPSWYSLSVFI